MGTDGDVTKPLFNCDFCDLRFNAESDLRKHQDAKHQDNMFRYCLLYGSGCGMDLFVQFETKSYLKTSQNW